MRAGSPHESGRGDWDVVRESGKAVASSGSVILECFAPIKKSEKIGGGKIDNDSEDPGKTHSSSELGSCYSNTMKAGGATGRLGLAQS